MIPKNIEMEPSKFQNKPHIPYSSDSYNQYQGNGTTIVITGAWTQQIKEHIVAK